MRLWSIHPRYLDAIGLIALWREGLLARKVLRGATRGYKHHPQLQRFCQTDNPIAAIDVFLRCVLDEAVARGYNFDASKIDTTAQCGQIQVTSGQLNYEYNLLAHKLRMRSPERYCYLLLSADCVIPNNLLRIIKGETEQWERVKKI